MAFVYSDHQSISNVRLLNFGVVLSLDVSPLWSPQLVSLSGSRIRNTEAPRYGFQLSQVANTSFVKYVLARVNELDPSDYKHGPEYAIVAGDVNRLEELASRSMRRAEISINSADLAFHTERTL